MKPTLIKYFIPHSSLEKAATFEARFYVASPLLRLLNVLKYIAGWCWLETGKTPHFIGSIYYFFYLNYFYFYIRKLDCLCKKGSIYCWWDSWLIFSEFLALGYVSLGWSYAGMYPDVFWQHSVTIGAKTKLPIFVSFKNGNSIQG